MSYKCNTFVQSITNPHNTYQFKVVIGGVDDSITLLVESADFPTQGAFRELTLWNHGEKISYPGLPENGGQWKVKIPESDNGKVAREFKKLTDAAYDQVTGKLKPTVWKKIQVFSQDTQQNNVFHVNLMGCWIMSRQQVGLNGADPAGIWKWDFVFYYNYLIDKDDNNEGSPAPLGATVEAD